MKKQTLNQDRIHRLSFARYLLTQAKAHKEKGYPLSSFTILILHDSVEIFIQVAAEILTPQVTKPKDKILETLGKHLNDYLANEGKMQIPPHFLTRINNLRNPLKHHSIFAEQSEIEKIYIETETFFNDYSTTLFEIELHELNLVGLIKNEQIKLCLSEAEQYISSAKANHAIVAIAKAYHYLEHIEFSRLDGFGGSFLSRERRTRYNLERSLRDNNMGYNTNTTDRRLDGLVKTLSKDIGEIQDRIFKFRKGSKFR